MVRKFTDDRQITAKLTADHFPSRFYYVVVIAAVCCGGDILRNSIARWNNAYNCQLGRSNLDTWQSPFSASLTSVFIIRDSMISVVRAESRVWHRDREKHAYERQAYLRTCWETTYHRRDAEHRQLDKKIIG
ncbi:hypothetical protein U1Q18_051114 [Sarracenia purpurea var. burkii]